MWRFVGSFFLVLLLWREDTVAQLPSPESIILASTTSVKDSGLLAHILPDFALKTGITVDVLAVGTGLALQAVVRDEADVVLVHDPEAEERFIAEGHGIEPRRCGTAHSPCPRA